MYSQIRIVLDNGTSVEVHGEKVLCFAEDHRAIHLTPAQASMLKVFAEKLNDRVTSSELYAAYTKEDTFWESREISSNVSKLIHTFPPVIHEKIDNVRGKGYRLTGQRVLPAPCDNDPAAGPGEQPGGYPAANCRLKSTNIQTKPVFVADRKRELLFEKIDHAFRDGYNAVFLQGFGGIGKSEFAKQYAKRRKADGTYSTVVFAPIDVRRGNVNLQTLICDDTVFSIANFPKRNETVRFDNRGSLENRNESMEEYFERKYAKIRELCDRETLIIIDNFDVAHDSEIIRFLEGNYHVIITTRYRFADIDCPQIAVEYMDHGALAELFFRYSGRSGISADDPGLTEIFDLLGQHTMSVELLARYMADNEMLSLAEVSEKLRRRGSFGNLDGSVQMSSADLARRPFEYIAALFDLSSLMNDKHADDFRKILSGLCLMPVGGVKKYDFLQWCGINSAAALNKLIRRSWIFEEKRDAELWISMHSVVSEVMLHQFSPSLETCGELVDSLIRISKEAYFLSLKQAAHLTPVLKRIVCLCPVNGLEHYETYLLFADFFALREQPESAAEILSALLSLAEGDPMAHPLFSGRICASYGVYYSSIRKYPEAIRWRKKAIGFYEELGGYADEIQNLKIEIAWNCLNCKDISAAVATVPQLDLWLTEAEAHTRRKGALLHLKARIEYEQGHYDAAKACDSAALEIFEKINKDGIDCGSANYILGLSNTKCEATFETGILQLKKCLSIWQEYRSRSSTNMIDIHRMIADAYFDNTRYADALLWYEKCMGFLADHAAIVHSQMVQTSIMTRMERCRAEICGKG